LVTRLDELQVREAPEPTLESGQVLVEIYAVGSNLFDILMVQGKYQIKPALPFTPGSEFAGIIIKKDPQVTRFNIGDRVFGSARYGCYAERISVPANQCLPIPENLSFRQACGIFTTWSTSFAALKLRAKLKRGEICLIHAAAGGVGLAAVQIAKVLGATVIEKLMIARQYGADYTVNYNDPEWPKKVKEYTPEGRGVDVVYDSVGLLGPSLSCVAWSARLLVIGFAGGKIESIPANRILLKNASLIGLFWGSYAQYDPKVFYSVWDELLPMFKSGKIQPVVYKEQFIGLESVPAALEAIASRRSFGKVVVTVRQEGQAHL
jgi:NADPH2:quinone reductase